MRLGVGFMIGTFTGFEDNQVDNCLLGADDIEDRANCTSVRGREVPEQSQKLYNSAERSGRVRRSPGHWQDC